MFNIIDLGTSKITGITVKESNGMQKVVGFSSKSTAGLKKGSIINITETSKTIAEVVEELQSQSGENIRVVDVSFSGELISSTNSTGLATISDKEVSVKDQQSALQTSIAMNVPGDKELLNVVPSETKSDELSINPVIAPITESSVNWIAIKSPVVAPVPFT